MGKKLTMDPTHDAFLRGYDFGWESGMEQRRRTVRNLVLEQIYIRCGDIPECHVQRIYRLPLDQAEKLGVALLKFKNAASLKRWLSLHAPLPPKSDETKSKN